MQRWGEQGRLNKDGEGATKVENFSLGSPHRLTPHRLIYLNIPDRWGDFGLRLTRFVHENVALCN